MHNQVQSKGYTLPELLNQSGHLWYVEERVNAWSVKTVYEFEAIVNELYYKCYDWNISTSKENLRYWLRQMYTEKAARAVSGDFDAIAVILTGSAGLARRIGIKQVEWTTGNNVLSMSIIMDDDRLSGRFHDAFAATIIDAIKHWTHVVKPYSNVTVYYPQDF